MLYFETEIGKNCGFTIEAEGVSGRLAYLVLSGSGGKQIYPVNLNPARILKHKMEKYMKRGHGLLENPWHAGPDGPGGKGALSSF